jgi:glutamine amidotransferase
MQLLMSVGEEFGEHPGLGLIPGRVVKLTPTAPDGRALKLPHIGWNRINPGPSGWAGTTLSDLKAGTAVYFVHSYAPQPQDPAHVMATCEYGTTRFCSAVRRENLSGCQFHPEKSGPTGLLILSRFLRH